MKIFSHDLAGGLFSSSSDAMNKNLYSPESLLHSRLCCLESYRNTAGQLHLKLCYPEIKGNNCNEWKQTSNPVTEGTITGYEPISIAFPANGNGNPWAGLGKSEQPSTLIDDTGSEATAWMAVGAFKFTSKDKIPGPWGSQVTRVELFVCPWDKECHIGGRYSSMFVCVANLYSYYIVD